MKKSIIVLIAVVIFSLMLFGCTTTAAETTTTAAELEKGTIYYLCPNQFDEMQTNASKSITESLENIGYTCNVVTAGNEDASLQMNQIENAITQKPLAIIVAAVDATAICSGVSKAHEAGIPVIAYDRTISKCSVEFTSVADCKVMGIMAGQETVKLLKEKNGDAKGTVLDIMGDPLDSYTVMIEEGFQEEIKKYPDIKVQTKITNGWDAATAGNTADDFLLANPDTDFIFTHADHLAAAVASVLETKGYKPGDILLMGTAGMPMGLELIRSGWMTVDIEYSPMSLAEGIVMFLDDILNKNEIKPGSYTVMGRSAELTIQSFGPELKIAGSVVNSENVDDPNLWGNQVSK